MPPPAVPQLPWPEQADGDAPSLFLNAPISAPDSAGPSSWTASLSADGSPGQEQLSEFTGDPLADADQDGDGVSRHTYRLNVPMDGTSRQFIRLGVRY